MYVGSALNITASSCTVMTQQVVDLVGFIWVFWVYLGLVGSIEGKGET